MMPRTFTKWSCWERTFRARALRVGLESLSDACWRNACIFTALSESLRWLWLPRSCRNDTTLAAFLSSFFAATGWTAALATVAFFCTRPLSFLFAA